MLKGTIAAAAMVLVTAPGAAAAQAEAAWFGAVNAGDTATVQRMLDAGQILVDARDAGLNTALHLAAERCDVGMIRLLRSRGANPAAGNEYGNNPRGVAGARCGAGSAAVAAMDGAQAPAVAAAAPPPPAPAPAPAPAPMPSAAPAMSQDGKTPANAYAFIARSMTDGTWRAPIEICAGIAGTNCYGTADRPIVAVDYLGGSYCVIRIGMRDNYATRYRTLDLRSELEIIPNDGMARIYFAGAIPRSGGGALSSWELGGSNQGLVWRVGEALLYLQEKCKPGSIW